MGVIGTVGLADALRARTGVQVATTALHTAMQGPFARGYKEHVVDQIIMKKFSLNAATNGTGGHVLQLVY